MCVSFLCVNFCNNIEMVPKISQIMLVFFFWVVHYRNIQEALILAVVL